MVFFVGVVYAIHLRFARSILMLLSQSWIWSVARLAVVVTPVLFTSTLTFLRRQFRQNTFNYFWGSFWLWNDRNWTQVDTLSLLGDLFLGAWLLFDWNLLRLNWLARLGLLRDFLYWRLILGRDLNRQRLLLFYLLGRNPVFGWRVLFEKLQRSLDWWLSEQRSV